MLDSIFFFFSQQVQLVFLLSLESICILYLLFWPVWSWAPWPLRQSTFSTGSAPAATVTIFQVLVSSKHSSFKTDEPWQMSVTTCAMAPSARASDSPCTGTSPTRPPATAAAGTRAAAPRTSATAGSSATSFLLPRRATRTRCLPSAAACLQSKTAVSTSSQYPEQCRVVC